MIDEKTLYNRLNAAAEAQDALLPRSLADDLAAGRRRLLRRRVLAAASATAAVLVVAVGAAGLAAPLRAAKEHAPAANQQTKADEQAGNDAAAASLGQQFDGLMKGLLAKHLDPARKHLDFTPGPFMVDQNIGSHGTFREVGWKVPGEAGEGEVVVGLSRSEKQAGNTCGSYFQPQIKCHRITLPNGRPAMIGHRDRTVELGYVQPDGEYAYIAAGPLFGNNSTVPVKTLAITDAQLIAFVTDPDLNLPPLTSAQQKQEDSLKNFAPAPETVQTVAARHLAGKLAPESVTDTAVDLTVVDRWTSGSATATVEVSFDPAVLRSECKDQLSVPACTPVALPNGGTGEYAEGARTYQGGPAYVMGATYVQPDGDLIAVRVLYPGTNAPTSGITKQQILALLVDPALDR